jgi:hypothetical protein
MLPQGSCLMHMPAGRAERQLMILVVEHRRHASVLSAAIARHWSLVLFPRKVLYIGELTTRSNAVTNTSVHEIVPHVPPPKVGCTPSITG